MDDEERIKKSFDFAADLSKQLITLATGIIALTITFSKDFLIHPANDARCFAYFAWYFFLTSIVLGLLTLATLTGQLGAKEKVAAPSIYAGNILAFAKLQWLTFSLAMLLTIIYAVQTI